MVCNRSQDTYHEFEHNIVKVSIVTPSYNQVRFLDETIRSVLSQDYQNIEYMIIDGGSTDGSVEIIRKYADDLAWWTSEPDHGQTDAINKGFARATGDIFAWLNSDDTYEPGAVSQAVGYLQTHPEAGLVYGNANLIDEKGKLLGKFPARDTDYQKLLRGYVHIPQQAAFFRGLLWKMVGPLDLNFTFAMDYDLWVRMAKISELHHIPSLWANFRLHSSGKTNIIDNLCYPEMLKVYYRERGKKPSWLAAKAMVRRFGYSRLPVSFRIWLNRFTPW